MSAHLSESLRKKYGKRNFPLKKGDSVKIMVGGFKGKDGKIDKVDLKRLRVMIEGIYRTKKDGTKVSVYFDPSNLQIKELNLEDKKRRVALERKVGGKVERVEDKSNKSEGKVEKKKGIKFKPLPKSKEGEKK